jgi:hypothetical protein
MSADGRGPKSEVRGPEYLFDLAIDRAVREMLDVEPRADLRGRVLAQVDASGSRLPASSFRLPASGWALGTLAAAALIVLAVFVARRSEPVAPATRVATRGTDQPLVVTPEGPQRRPASVPMPSQRVIAALPRAARTPAARHAIPLPAAGVVVATVADGEPVDIVPLQTITPIQIDPIAPQRIAPADLALHPLNPITDVQIAPLTPPDRRN